MRNRLRRAWLVTAVLAAPLAGPPAALAAASEDGALRLSREPVAEDPSWKRYVLDDPDGLVYPVGVEVEGDTSRVRDPEGLRAPGGGATTIQATDAGAPRLRLDLGLNTGGIVEVGVTRGDGTRLRLAYSEAKRFLTPQGDTTSSSLGNDDDPDARSDVFDTPRGPGDLRTPTTRGAQRWVLLQLEGAGEITIDYVRVRVNHYRPEVGDYTGHFLSSDDQVNRTWYASVYTWSVDTFRDERNGGKLVVTDGGKRDRLVWLGDLAIENLLAAYSVRAHEEVIRNSIEMFACQQEPDGYLPMTSRPSVTCPGEPGPPDGTSPQNSPLVRALRLPEYTGWWIVALAEFHELSGDDAFARRMLPVARRAIGYFRANRSAARGLFYTPPNSINWHPFDVAQGEDTHTNAVWVRALRGLARLERELGDGEAGAEPLERDAGALREAMLRHLYDRGAGAFLLNAEDPRPNHPHDGNVEAVLAGVVTGDEARSALEFVRRRLGTKFGPLTGEFPDDPYMSQYISPFISSDELLARFGRRDGEGAMDLLRRLYGHMVDTDPHVTMWEKMSPSGDAASYSPNQLGGGLVPTQLSAAGPGLTSLAHGWSGGPAPALSAYVAGMRPAASGWRRWIVEPQPTDLRFAQGRARTPRGSIASRWVRGTGDRSFQLTVEGPSESPGTVSVPQLGRPRTIAMDGRVVWRDGRPVDGAEATLDGDHVAFAGVRGTHTFAWGEPAESLGLPDARRCVSRRNFSIRLRAPRGQRLRSARVFVAGRSVRVLKGRRLRARVDLRGLPKGRVRVRIVATTTRGRRIRSTRTYRTCTPGRGVRSPR